MGVVGTFWYARVGGGWGMVGISNWQLNKFIERASGSTSNPLSIIIIVIGADFGSAYSAE